MAWTSAAQHCRLSPISVLTVTDVARPGSAWPVLSINPPIRALRLVTTTVGLGAAVLGIWGFFINIIHSANTSLSGSSGWWRLMPISIGVAALGLLIPRARYFTAGLPLLALGMLFFLGPLVSHPHPGGSNPGYGFWMIAVGSGILTLVALMNVSIDLVLGNSANGPSEGAKADGTAHPEAVQRKSPRPRRWAIGGFGLAAGAVAFAGYFVNFYSHEPALSSWNVGGWWFFVPISTGLGTLGLLIRRAPLFTSGLPLMAMGLALGFFVYESTVRIPFPPLGYGFWMITVGAGGVVLAGWGLIVFDLRSLGHPPSTDWRVTYGRGTRSNSEGRRHPSVG